MASLPANLPFFTADHLQMMVDCINNVNEYVSIRNAAALVCWWLLQHDHLHFANTLFKQELHLALTASCTAVMKVRRGSGRATVNIYSSRTRARARTSPPLLKPRCVAGGGGGAGSIRYLMCPHGWSDTLGRVRGYAR